MQRLPFNVCEPIYRALGRTFTKEQFEIVSQQDRFPVITGGERGGKSFTTESILLPHVVLLPEIKRNEFYHVVIDGVCTCKKFKCGKVGQPLFNPSDKASQPKNPHFVIFGPRYKEPKIEFEYLEDSLRKLGELSPNVSKPQDGPWRLITKSGVVVETHSCEIPGNIRSMNLEGAVVAEAGNVVWDAITRIQGRVGSKKGFIIYSGTLENAQVWYQRWTVEGQRQNKMRIKAYSLPSWTNLFDFPGGERNDEIQRWREFYGEDLFNMRVAAIPTPRRERVIHEFQNRHIKKLKIPRDEHGNYSCEFHLYIDPGYLPSAYAVLFVATWKENGKRIFYIFDEIYEQSKVTDQIIDMVKRHKFFKRIKKIVIDISSKRHADGNEPALDIWKKRVRREYYMKYWKEAALIERLRISFNNDQIFIHPNCRGLIAEGGLGEEVYPEMHPWKYPTDKDGKIIGEKPEDKWNHSFKALGYGVLSELGLVERMGEARKKPYNRLKPKESSRVFKKRR